MFFGVVGIVLFCTTPLGAGLPGAVAEVAGWLGDQGGSVAQASTNK